MLPSDGAGRCGRRQPFKVLQAEQQGNESHGLGGQFALGNVARMHFHGLCIVAGCVLLQQAMKEARSVATVQVDAGCFKERDQQS